MSMTDKQVNDIIYQEFANKTPFDCKYRGNCDVCQLNLSEGDIFFFYGNKRKMCMDCQQDLINSLGAH